MPRSPGYWTVSLAMLHPLMPFITEELWQNAARDTGEPRPLLILSDWPTPTFEDSAAAAEINWLIEFIIGGPVGPIGNERSGGGDGAALCGRCSRSRLRPDCRPTTPLIKRLARASDDQLGRARHRRAPFRSSSAKRPSRCRSLASSILKLSAPGLRKEVDKAGKEIAKIEAKLGNEQFMAKAKEEVVEEQRERLAEATAEGQDRSGSRASCRA